MIKKIFLAIAIFYLLGSCRKDQYVEPYCFDTDIQPILINKCGMSGCHNSTDKVKDLDLTNYDAIQNFSQKENILRQIQKGKMPPEGKTPLSDAEKNLIARWAGDKYSRGDCSTSTNTCDTTNVTYNSVLKSIFDTNCSGCHNASNRSGGWALDSYNEVKNTASSGRLLGAIKGQTGFVKMPPSGTLSSCQISKIEAWINKGMPGIILFHYGKNFNFLMSKNSFLAK